MNKAILPTVLLLSLAFVSGCCCCHKAEQITFPRTEISFSSGGGFSGFYSGHTIAPDRVVTSWNGRGGKPKDVDTVGIMDEDTYQNLLQTIYDEHPEAIQQQETGNMTTALTITSNDEQYLYTWEGVHSDEQAVPASVLALRNPVWKVLQAVILTNQE